jgi:Cro/C1-type HTH DNA-binding domain
MDFETLQRRLLASVKDKVQNGEMTERGLARMTGISQPHMHHILKGARRLSVENADRILSQLNMTVIDLLDGGESNWRIPPRLGPYGVGTGQKGGEIDEPTRVDSWLTVTKWEAETAKAQAIL